MNSIDERISDILKLIDGLPIHTEKFSVLADCLHSFTLFKTYFENTDSNLNKTNISRFDFALGELQAILLMIGPEVWIDYICHTSIDHAINVLKAKMSEMKEYTNIMFNINTGIFDIPQYKLNYADFLDLKKLLKIIKNIPPDKFGDSDPNNIKQNINKALEAYKSPKCFTFQQIQSFRKFYVDTEDLEILKKIGSGTFSTIFQGRRKSTNEEVAIKFFTSAHSRTEHFNQLICEANAYSRLNHKNIVKFHGVTKEPPFMLITEFMDGGSLFRGLQTPGALDAPEMLDHIALSIANGLVYLHKLGSIHGDIKSLNILLSKSGGVKLCDFGSSRVFHDPNADIGPIGTISWSAPEMLRTEGERMISPAADVYSYGVVLLEMATRRPPESNNRKVVPPDTPPKLRSLIEKCLSADPFMRPTMSEIVQMFEQKLISFAKSAEIKVSTNALNFLIENATKDSYDLLGDICAEIPTTREFVLAKIAQKNVSNAVKGSLIRALRAICRTKELCEQAIKLGVIELCLGFLDKDELQVRSLFLLLSVVRLAEYSFSESELNILHEYPDSLLVTICLLYGTKLDENEIGKYLDLILSCHDQILPSILCGLRRYFKTNTEPINEQLFYKIATSLFTVLQSNEETSATQAILIFSDVLPLISFDLVMSPQHMILIGKWIFVKNTAIHISAVNLLSLVVYSPNVKIIANGVYEFMVILLHSLPLSCVKDQLSNSVLKLLSQQDIGQWFVEKQLNNFMLGDIPLELKPVMIKMLACVAWTKHDNLISPGAQKTIRDVIALNNDDLYRLVCRFIIASGKAVEYLNLLGSGRFVDEVERTDNVDVVMDTIKLFKVTHNGCTKLEFKRLATASTKFIENESVKLHILWLYVLSFRITKDTNFIKDVKSLIIENKDLLDCNDIIDMLNAN